jgi:hypothetical protein
MAQEQDMKQTRKKHGAAFKERLNKGWNWGKEA